MINDNAMATGVLIDSQTVLTAGHTGVHFARTIMVHFGPHGARGVCVCFVRFFLC